MNPAQAIRRITQLSAAIGVFSLASCEKPAPAATVGKPEASLVTATDASVNIESFARVTIGESGGPTTLLGALNKTKSENAYNELAATKNGIYTFAIMREGDALKFEYPPKNAGLMHGDVILRFTGLSEEQYSLAFKAASTSPASTNIAKFEGALSQVFHTQEKRELETAKANLVRGTSVGLEKFISGATNEVRVKSGQTFSGAISARLPKSSQKLDSSSRIALNLLLVDYVATVHNPDVDPARIAAGQKLRIPDLSTLDRSLATNPKRLDPLLTSLSRFVNSKSQIAAIDARLAELAQP